MAEPTPVPSQCGFGCCGLFRQGRVSVSCDCVDQEDAPVRIPKICPTAYGHIWALPKA